MTFTQFNLAASLLQSLDAMGYTTPTPVQIATIPAALDGGDWMVSSQTGSGKTAAFLIPSLHALIASDAPTAAKDKTTAAGRFSRKPSVARPRVLVLCPTRELAQQVAQEAIQLVSFTRGVRIATVLGGTAYMMQLQALENASLVVATPGRLLDLHRNAQIVLDDVQTLVVDEADRMLDLGFSEDLEAIHQATAARARTMMFSATFAPRIMRLAEAVMRDPQKIELATAQDAHQNIAQRLHWVDDASHKAKVLEHYLNDEAMLQAVVFTSTQVETDQLSDQLREAGYRASALHGGLPQAMRNRRIKSLREGHIQILVATDVAARGIDVPAISHVINYGLPRKAEDYVHRIGRTGRAGRDGLAITLASARDRYAVRNIEQFTQQRIDVKEVEGLAPKSVAAAPRGRPGSRDDKRTPHRDARSSSVTQTGKSSGAAFAGPRTTPAREAFAQTLQTQTRDEAAPRDRPAHRGDFSARSHQPRNERFAKPYAKPEFSARHDHAAPASRRRVHADAPRRDDARSEHAPVNPVATVTPRPQWTRHDDAQVSSPPTQRRSGPASHATAHAPSHAPSHAAPREASYKAPHKATERKGNREHVAHARTHEAAARPSARAPYAKHHATDSVKPAAQKFGAAPRSATVMTTAAEKQPGPAATPPHPDGNRALRRAKLHAEWVARQQA